MKLLAGLALASMAVAAPLVDKRAPTPLNVELQMMGNSKVKAVITNNGRSNLKLLKVGTFLDTAPVERAQVFSAEKSVPFDGVRISLDTSVLDDTAFQSIPSGGSYEVSFDIAEFHDLSAGGKFSVLSSGALSFATENSTELVGSVPFYSNRLDAEVDGPQAFSVRTAFHQKRTNVQSDCSGNKLAATQAALANCARQASLAQQAASNGPAEKMEEYFKASDPATRSTVADVFSRIAAECGSTNAGDSRYYCSDVYGSCQNGVLAYTLPGGSYMAYCDLYFDRLPATTTNCHGQDQGNTNLHEMTHLNQIKGTSDFGGYGYNFLRSLTAEQNINHADTYALFANAAALGC
ncbi:related to neutral proteinase [Fusarium torulosum]|uniref:Neutral protease 2 n=1 Tax=Fusarium torulosum TaxID=33205 RepID=A0AAE8SMJ0_9HYPO|nr:related to neutral proteinase [Fusarium torulosum]